MDSEKRVVRLRFSEALLHLEAGVSIRRGLWEPSECVIMVQGPTGDRAFLHAVSRTTHMEIRLFNALQEDLVANDWIALVAQTGGGF